MSRLLEEARAGTGSKENRPPPEEGDFNTSWRPDKEGEKGDYACGVITDVREHDFGYNPVKILTFEGEYTLGGEVQPDKTFDVHMNVKILKDEFAAQRMMKGDEVLIRWDGWAQTDGGRKYKDFYVKKEGTEGGEQEAF